MALYTAETLTATLTAQGNQNLPVVGHFNYADSDGYFTDLGTEVFPASNAVARSTYNFWEVTPSAGRAIIEMDLPGGFSRSVSFVSVAAHNLGDFSDSGCLVRPQYSSDRITWTNPMPPVTPTDNSAMGFRFAPVLAPYWRFNITSLPAENVRIGVLFFGRDVMFPHDIYADYAPPLLQTNVELQSNVSEGGHLLGNSVVRKSSSTSANIQYGTPDYFRDAEWLDFQADFNNGQGFFWAWRPGEYSDFYYGWRSGSPIVPANTGAGGNMSASMKMRLYDDP